MAPSGDRPMEIATVTALSGWLVGEAHQFGLSSDFACVALWLAVVVLAGVCVWRPR